MRPNDFSFTNEGELVFFPMLECDHGIDGPCGCRRDMCGFVTHKGTTTFMVVDDPSLTVAAFKKAHRDSMRHAGWHLASVKRLAEEATLLLALAAKLPPGIVLERRDRIQRRTPKGVRRA